MSFEIPFVFKLLLTFELVLSQPNEGIIDVRLTDPLTPNIGGVQVHFKETTTSSPSWLPVCREPNHQRDETWGQEEARVTCRYLHYLGGWPYTYLSNIQTAAIDDVICVGDETHLGYCTYDGETYLDGDSACGLNNQAGVRCYDSALVRLIQANLKDNPNQGVLEIKYNTGDTSDWLEVCFDGTVELNQPWTLHNAGLVCVQLGYPGAMRTYKGTLDRSINRESVDNFNCREGDQLISQCTVDSPQMYSCNKYDKVEIICFIPGYVGCFEDNGQILPLDGPFDPNLTIIKCLDFCRGLRQQVKYAGVAGGTKCKCGTAEQEQGNGELLSNDECQSPCGGEENMFCGGQNRISIYRVDLNVCVDPGTPANSERLGESYSYGSVITYNCDEGHTLIGEATIQCIQDFTTNIMIWNGTKPYCQASPTTSLPKTPTPGLREGAVDHPVDIGLLVGILAAALLLIVLIIASICFIFWRKKAMREDNIAACDMSISGISGEMVYPSPVFDDTGEIIPNPYFDPSMSAAGGYPEYEDMVLHEKPEKVPMDDTGVPFSQVSAMNMYVADPSTGATVPSGPPMGAMAPPEYEAYISEKTGKP